MKWLALLMTVLGASAPAAASPQDLAQLNGMFRSAYKDTRARLQQQQNPVIIAYSGDRVVLLQDGKRTEAVTVGQRYTTLKTMAHATLGVFALLMRDGAPPLDDTTRATAQQFLAQLHKSTQDWSLLDVDIEQVTRQQKLVLAMETFVHEVLQRGRFANVAEMQAFTQSVRAPVYQNVRDAGHALVDGLQRVIPEWRKSMGEAAWQRLRVVVVGGSHMAEQGEATKQYFLHVLQQQSEGDRVVFALHPCDDAHALEVLSVHMIDRSVSEAFWQDPMRMHRDVMADGVTDYLNEIPY